MASLIERTALLAALRAALQDNDQVDAAWEGGSAAFPGGVDAWSDVDVVAVVADDAVASTFEHVEAALQRLSPIALRLDMPAAAGYAQKFYRLRDAGEFLVVDLVLIRRSDPLLFRETELHGHGLHWFDRSGVLAESHLDSEQEMAAARACVPLLRAHFQMFQHLVSKERMRGHGSDAMAFYQAYTLRPLVEALRLLHLPHSRIFGLRYLARDLPPQVVQRIERLLFIRDLQHLAQAHGEAAEWFEQCLQRLERCGPGAGIQPASAALRM